MSVFKYHAFIFYMRPPRWLYGTMPSFTVLLFLDLRRGLIVIFHLYTRPGLAHSGRSQLLTNQCFVRCQVLYSNLRIYVLMTRYMYYWRVQLVCTVSSLTYRVRSIIWFRHFIRGQNKNVQQRIVRAPRRDDHMSSLQRVIKGVTFIIIIVPSFYFLFTH